MYVSQNLGHYLIFQVFPNSCCQKEINTALYFLQAENGSLSRKSEKKHFFRISGLTKLHFGAIL